MRFLLAAIFAAFFMSAPRAEQHEGPTCAPFEQLVDGLEETYDEIVRSHGLSHNGQMFVLFANSETGTWTMVGVVPNGMGCILATGEAWQRVAERIGRGV